MAAAPRGPRLLRKRGKRPAVGTEAVKSLDRRRRERRSLALLLRTHRRAATGRRHHLDVLANP
jgi:hypothetical protein